MYHANNEEPETTHDGRNRTTKSRKNQSARRKENLQIIGNIENRYHQTSGDERKKFLKYLWRTRKLLQTKLCSCPPSKIIGTILEVGEERTSTKKPENKKTNDDA